jgi:acylphosphatase
MKRHLDIKIYGKVQGVFFRWSSRLEAEKLGITGCVENKPDGSVWIEAESEKENLEKFLDWCRKGPEKAKVEKIEFEFSDKLIGFSGFKSR